MFKKVGLGGTFDVLHTGHVRLIAEALRRGEHVVVGVTSDEFAWRSKPYPVRRFEERVRKVVSLLRSLVRGEVFEIVKINDRCGTAVTDPEMEAIVVSVETLGPAFDINEVRVQRNMSPLHILVIPVLRDAFGEKYSSRRLRCYLSK